MVIGVAASYALPTQQRWYNTPVFIGSSGRLPIPHSTGVTPLSSANIDFLMLSDVDPMHPQRSLTFTHSIVYGYTHLELFWMPHVLRDANISIWVVV